MGGVAEVIAAAVQEETVAAAAAQPLPPPPGSADDLTRMKGVGPKLAALLGSLGVTSYAQIAAWSDADLERIDGQLGTFSGRPQRDRWIDQARLLAAGDTAAYEGMFGKL
jgi:predicted flap endonuclease-1-like 5' DNA nuclease